MTLVGHCPEVTLRYVAFVEHECGFMMMTTTRNPQPHSPKIPNLTTYDLSPKSGNTQEAQPPLPPVPVQEAPFRLSHRHPESGLGFRVHGTGFSLGFRVRGLRFRV